MAHPTRTDIYLESPAPFLVGLTGCMGSGKSSVAAAFCSENFITCIDADLICRHLLEPGEDGWQIIKKEFGDDFLDPQGRIDRVLLRRKIFSEKSVRLKLDALIHPIAWEAIYASIVRSGEQLKKTPILVEVPLLYEAGWEPFFSKVVMVYADPDTCVNRLMKRDGISREEARNALATQWPADRKVQLADHVIDNSGTWWETSLQLTHLQKLLWKVERSCD